MKRLITYCLFAFSITGFVSCNGKKQVAQKEIDPRVTIWRKDKIPYGAFYAYEQLHYMFPKAEIIVDNEAPDKKSVFGQKKAQDLDDKLIIHKGNIAQFIMTPAMNPDGNEIDAIMNFVYEGNHVFISTFDIGPDFLSRLNLKTYYNDGWLDYGDSLKVNIVNPETGIEEKFSYPGKTNDNFFSTYNENYITILGRNNNGNPNFIKIKYENGGSIYLHLAPLALSNFFLLHKDNKKYYDYALSNLPEDLALITWGEYFRGNSDSGNSVAKAFKWIMKQPPLAWGFLLLLLLFLLIYLFESKRKQRMVPIRPPLKNSSLDFVKTIGRLYYQRRDNKNLASKMTAHFMDHVRNKYNIPTSRMDDQFEAKLAYKTGIDQKIIHDIIYQSNYMDNQSSVTDGELLQFNQQLQNFYKQA